MFAKRGSRKYTGVAEEDASQSASKKSSSSTRLLLVIAVLNAVYCIAEFIAAVHFDSLALLIDAFHNMGDVGNTLIALYCERAKSMHAGSMFSFGRERMEVLGALVNACTLLALSLYTVLDCVHSLLDPHPMKIGLLYLIVAGLGLPVNLISAMLAIWGGHEHTHGLRKCNGDHSADPQGCDGCDGYSETFDVFTKVTKLGSKSNTDILPTTLTPRAPTPTPTHKNTHKNLNMWAVGVHNLGDAAGSLLVLLVGIIVHIYPSHSATHWTAYLDPAAALLLAGVIAATALPLVFECGRILMDATPEGVDVQALTAGLEDISHCHGITRQSKGQRVAVAFATKIKAVHVWQLDSGSKCAAALRLEVCISNSTASTGEPVPVPVLRKSRGTKRMKMKVPTSSLGLGLSLGCSKFDVGDSKQEREEERELVSKVTKLALDIVQRHAPTVQRELCFVEVAVAVEEGAEDEVEVDFGAIVNGGVKGKQPATATPAVPVVSGRKQKQAPAQTAQALGFLEDELLCGTCIAVV